MPRKTMESIITESEILKHHKTQIRSNQRRSKTIVLKTLAEKIGVDIN